MKNEKRLERIEKQAGIFEGAQPLTVVDPDTGLEWEAAGSSDQMDWEEAHLYCNSLNEKNYAGYSDWRIPASTELHSLADKDAEHNPCIKPLPGIQCQSGFYWSSTTYAGTIEVSWVVGFYVGNGSNENMSGDYYVRCVRSIKE